MDLEPAAKGRPAPTGARREDRLLIDPRRLDPSTGTPETLVQEHELWVEREPWAKYTGALAGMRIAAALALRSKRKARGEYVPPQPWFPALVTTGLAAAVLGGAAAIVWLVGRV